MKDNYCILILGDFMYFLLDACQHPTFLRVLYFGYLFWEILAVVIPIGLIIMLMIDFTKAVVISKEDEQIKSMKLVGKRIIYAVFIFATPWLVSFIMTLIDSFGVDIGGDYNLCINTVKAINEGTDNIEKYDKLLEEEEKIEKEKIKENNNNNDNSNIPSSKENNTADRMISIAKAELEKNDGTKYGGNPGDPWCAYFTTWVLRNTKMEDGTYIYNYLKKYGTIESDGVASGMWPAFRSSSNSNISFNKSKAYGGNYIPKKGDIIWFQWSSNGYCRNKYGKWNGAIQCADHIGIVESSDGKVVYTIEGNSGRKVSAREYSINDEQVVAYGSWY